MLCKSILRISKGRYNQLRYYNRSLRMTDNNMNNNNNDNDKYIEIKEGTSSMQYDKSEAVFYNKVQVFNRDISIQVIKHFAKVYEDEKQERYQKKLAKYELDISKKKDNDNNNNKDKKNHDDDIEYNRPPFMPSEGISILDALAATGLRSIRYIKEIPGVRQLTINDLDPKATATAKKNCIHNNVDISKVTIHTGDAVMLMYNHRDAAQGVESQQFDVIDLDPYGTASPFLDSAVQAVTDGGLLCVTCTDMPVLAGNYPDVCFAKYGSMPLKAKYCHEMSLRTLLHAIDSAANKYKRYIVPWVSLSVDFYIRVFVRVFESPLEVKKSSLKRIMVYQSTQCPSFYIHRLGQITGTNKEGNPINYGAVPYQGPSKCEETNGNLKIGGPFWGDPLHSQDVVDELLKTVENLMKDENDGNTVPPPATGKRIIGILTSISEELKDVPFHYSLPDLAACVHIVTPPMIDFKSALHNLGYRSSQFHHNPDAVKTDAPPKVVWDVIRALAKITPPLGSSRKKTSEAAKAILQKELTTEIDFTIPTSFAERKDVARFPMNPESNWGPKARAGKTKRGEKNDDETLDNGPQKKK